MFKKLVSNLNFSPQVTSQLAFYAKRLRKENLTRKLSLIAGTFAVFMQFFAIAVPPVGANNSSLNDIIPSGFVTKDDLIQSINSSDELKALYHDYYHISDNDIRNASDPTYIPAKGSNLISIGRERYNSTDQVINVGSYTYYARTLGSVAETTNAHVIEGHNSQGAYFAVLLTCGNIAVETLPTPTAPPTPTTPAPTQKIPYGVIDTWDCNSVPGWAYDSDSPGTAIGIHIYIDNPASATRQVPSATDSYDYGATNVSRPDANKAYGISGNHGFNWQIPSKYKDGKTHRFYIYARGVNTSAQGGGKDGDTNNPEITAYSNKATSGQFKCGVAILPPPPPVTPTTTTHPPVAPPPPPPPPVTPPPPPHVTPPPPPPVTPPPPPVVSPPPPPPPVTPPPPPPPTPVTTPRLPHINQFKSAAYIQKDGKNGNMLDANNPNIKAGPGDIIEYTLRTTNSGEGVQVAYQLSEDLTDVLEYADITNLGGATLVNRTLIWPTVNIAAGSAISNVFQIRIKNPVPTTARSTSDLFSFDMQMNNVYGNTIVIPVAPPPIKQLEAAAQTLPQTGATTSASIMIGLFSLIVYFYLRNRQLSTEVKILRVEHNPGV